MAALLEYLLKAWDIPPRAMHSSPMFMYCKKLTCVFLASSGLNLVQSCSWPLGPIWKSPEDASRWFVGAIIEALGKKCCSFVKACILVFLSGAARIPGKLPRNSEEVHRCEWDSRECPCAAQSEAVQPGCLYPGSTPATVSRYSSFLVWKQCAISQQLSLKLGGSADAWLTVCTTRKSICVCVFSCTRAWAMVVGKNVDP